MKTSRFQKDLARRPPACGVERTAYFNNLILGRASAYQTKMHHEKTRLTFELLVAVSMGIPRFHRAGWHPMFCHSRERVGPRAYSVTGLSSRCGENLYRKQISASSSVSYIVYIEFLLPVSRVNYRSFLSFQILEVLSFCAGNRCNELQSYR